MAGNYDWTGRGKYFATIRLSDNELHLLDLQGIRWHIHFVLFCMFFALKNTIMYSS